MTEEPQKTHNIITAAQNRTQAFLTSSHEVEFQTQTGSDKFKQTFLKDTRDELVYIIIHMRTGFKAEHKGEWFIYLVRVKMIRTYKRVHKYQCKNIHLETFVLSVNQNFIYL